MRFMNIKQIAEKAGVSPKRGYYIKDRLGHLPTVKEVKEYKGYRGRPPKYTLSDREDD